MAEAVAARHRMFSEMPPPAMAKADLKKLEVALKQAIGRCVSQARKSLGWSQKELADAIERVTGEPRDVAQLSRWEAGTERPLFDVLWAVEPLRGPLVISLATLSNQIEIDTVIRIRRSA